MIKLTLNYIRPTFVKTPHITFSVNHPIRSSRSNGHYQYQTALCDCALAHDHKAVSWIVTLHMPNVLWNHWLEVHYHHSPKRGVIWNHLPTSHIWQNITSCVINVICPKSKTLPTLDFVNKTNKSFSLLYTVNLYTHAKECWGQQVEFPVTNQLQNLAADTNQDPPTMPSTCISLIIPQRKVFIKFPTKTLQLLVFH